MREEITAVTIMDQALNQIADMTTIIEMRKIGERIVPDDSVDSLRMFRSVNRTLVRETNRELMKGGYTL